MTLLNLIKITFYKSPEHVLFSQQSCPPATPRLVPTSFPLTGNKPTWSSPDLWPDHRETGWLSGGVTVDGVRVFHSITSHLLHLTHPNLWMALILPFLTPCFMPPQFGEALLYASCDSKISCILIRFSEHFLRFLLQNYLDLG